MKTKLTWYLGAVLVFGLAALGLSCAIIEPPNPVPPVATTVPPFIPHRLEGRNDCRVCHATGIAGAPQFPADHSRRPSDVCQTCHRPAPGLYADNEPIPIPMPVVTAETVPPVAATAPAEIPPPVTTTTPAEIPPSVTAPAPAGTIPTPVSAKDLFSTKCAACHGVNRQGIPGFAPGLLPEQHSHHSDDEIRNTILDGRPGTVMPAFKGVLSPEEIDALIQLIKSPSP